MLPWLLLPSQFQGDHVVGDPYTAKLKPVVCSLSTLGS